VVSKKTKAVKSKKKSPLMTTSTASVSAAAAAVISSNNTADLTNLTEIEQRKIQEMISLAQLESSKIKTSIVKEKKKEIDTLETVVKEFMGPFMLMGYDLNDNPIEMVSANSPAEYDALLERLRRVVVKINQNIANSNGNDPYGFSNT
jgi:uncharacterized protein (DUF885 family)